MFVISQYRYWHKMSIFWFYHQVAIGEPGKASEYPICTGKAAWRAALVKSFPKEEKAIDRFLELIMVFMFSWTEGHQFQHVSTENHVKVFYSISELVLKNITGYQRLSGERILCCSTYSYDCHGNEWEGIPDVKSLSYMSILKWEWHGTCFSF